MPAYLLTLPAVSGTTLKGGADAAVVFAENAADAKAMAAGQFDGDSNALWNDAVATEIVAAADFAGWQLRVAVLGLEEPIDVTVVGAAAATVDTIAALAVTALNATDAIANAAYNATSNTLTIAGVDDELGDKNVLVQFLPPAAVPGGISIPGFVGTITDGGAAEDALTVVLGADARAKPRFFGGLKVT